MTPDSEASSGARSLFACERWLETRASCGRDDHIAVFAAMLVFINSSKLLRVRIES